MHVDERSYDLDGSRAPLIRPPSIGVSSRTHAVSRRALLTLLLYWF